MGLRDILKKKEEVENGPARPESRDRLEPPELTLMRSDTISQEFLQAPGDEPAPSPAISNRSPRRSMDIFRPRSRSGSVSSQASVQSPTRRRISQRLHLSRQPESSENVPANLPDIVTPDAIGVDKEGAELQWEKRATMLAGQNELARSASVSLSSTEPVSPIRRARSPSAVCSQELDHDIQEAIRLHEAGHLEKSTVLFARLADPEGANNPLSQVLYGLALRHGWGCAPNPEAAIRYLSAAASNAASVEKLALQAGLKKGGAAKGELVLAIFELANCFRHGWGIPKDPIAAKQYYETAANLGDTDAMNEVAWCYLEGFGCKKDKYAAARYYRQAENSGSKTLGNSWIWKEKYGPPEEAGSNKK